MRAVARPVVFIVLAVLFSTSCDRRAVDCLSVDVKAGSAKKVEKCSGEVGLEVGKCAPPFSLSSINKSEGKISLDSLRGKVVVLEFWATWCGYCVRSLPLLARLADEVIGKPIVVVLVNIEENVDVDKIKKALLESPAKRKEYLIKSYDGEKDWIKEDFETSKAAVNKFLSVDSVYMLLDPKNEAWIKYGGDKRGIPTTLVIDKTGRIREIDYFVDWSSSFIKHYLELLSEL